MDRLIEINMIAAKMAGINVNSETMENTQTRRKNNKNK